MQFNFNERFQDNSLFSTSVYALLIFIRERRGFYRLNYQLKMKTVGYSDQEMSQKIKAKCVVMNGQESISPGRTLTEYLKSQTSSTEFGITLESKWK